MRAIAKFLRSCGIDAGKLYQVISAASLRAAIRQQGLDEMCRTLRRVVPNLQDQYTVRLDGEEYDRFWEPKMRGLHAWQVRLTLQALDHIGKQNQVIGDIGDSSGNHGLYIQAVAPEEQVERCIGINLDPVAVQKIQDKGGEAILCRAEDLDTEGIQADLFVSFQMLEHLTDPVRFLHNLAAHGSAEHMLLTVPYRKVSRFGGSHLRLPNELMPESMTAEEVHVYEFSPQDWCLLVQFAGWRIVSSDIYYQYPRHSPLAITAPIWRALDFEGFLGLFLVRDLTMANRYADW